MNRSKWLKLALISALFGVAAAFVSSHNLFLNLQTSTFNDLPADREKRSAIEDLAFRGILRGYDDGTVRAENTLTRAEFAVLLFRTEQKGSGSENCFPDVPADTWFEKAVCGLREVGIFRGFPDGTFKPNEKVTRADAVTAVCRFFEWNPEPPAKNPFTDVWKKSYFGPCLTFAKNQHLLSTDIENAALLKPSEYITRGDISVLISKSIARGTGAVASASKPDTAELRDAPEENTEMQNEVIAIAEEEQKEELEEEIIFAPIAPRSIPINFYSDLTLLNPLPNTFYRGELFYVEGTSAAHRTEKRAFVFIINKEGAAENFIADIENGAFRIPVFFTKPGNYDMGIILGTSGKSLIAPISILNTEPVEDANIAPPAQLPSAPQLTYNKDITTVSWNPKAETGKQIISRLTFSQNKKTKAFLSRQSVDHFDLRYTDFKGLNEGEITLSAETAHHNATVDLRISQWKKSETTTFVAAEHTYRDIVDETMVTALPETLAEPGLFEFKGVTRQKISRTGAFTLTNGTVETFSLHGGADGTEIPSGTTINYSRVLSERGRYIFEINDVGGGALINVPIYVDGTIPLIPDFFDLTSATLDPSPITDIAAARNDMLNFTNETRKQLALSTVVLADNLTQLAQTHSLHMVEAKFFAHINPAGETPDDRRKKANIATPVKENLAKSPTLQYAHMGLLRSPVHRENIIDPMWKRVGIGIAKDAEGYFFVTEEFAADPLTPENLTQMRDDFYANINAFRSQKTLSQIATSSQLEHVAQEWSDLMVSSGFFSFTASNGEQLLTRVRNAGITATLQAFILEGTDREKLLSELKNAEILLNSGVTGVGIGIAQTRLGDLRLTILYSL